MGFHCFLSPVGLIATIMGWGLLPSLSVPPQVNCEGWRLQSTLSWSFKAPQLVM